MLCCGKTDLASGRQLADLSQRCSEGVSDESADAVAVSMLRGISETLGAVRELGTTVNRDAAGARRLQAPNSFRQFPITAALRQLATSDVTARPRNGAMRASWRHTPCRWRRSDAR